jgi:hypothetical protein
MASNTPPSGNTAIGQQANQANNAKQIGQVIGNVIINECNPSPIESPSKKGNDQLIPDYLWYLPDRSTQRKELRKAIQEHENKAVHQPFLCLVHGKEQEEHYEFKECFVKDVLPRISKLYRSSSADSDGFRHIRFSVDFKNISELHEKILDKLTEKVLDYYPDDPKTAIAHQLVEEKRPIILCLNIYTKYCHYKNDIIKQGIIDFWKNWPELQKNKRYYRLLVFLLLQHPNKNEKFRGFTGFFKSSIQKFSQELRQLERMDFSTFLQQFKVGGVVLPRLSTIQENEAIQWLDIYQDRNPCFNETYKKAAKTEIERFYEKHPKGVPMGKLAQTLKKIVTEVREV